MVYPLSHLSFMTPYPSADGPRQTQPDTLTLTFRVTTAYITHTCSTVQPLHAHATRTYLSSFFSAFYGLDPLIYLSRPSLLFFYIIASHSRLPRSHLQPSHCDYLFRVVSQPWFDFGPVTILSCFFVRARRPSILCLVVIGSDRTTAAVEIEGGRSNPSACFENRVFSSTFFSSVSIRPFRRVRAVWQKSFVLK